VVGCGYWGKNLVRVFNDLGVLRLICDSDSSKSPGYEKNYPAVKFCSDTARVLASKDIDAVAIATPAATHYQLVKAALESGKDVFVEKPLALDVAEGERLVALSESRKRILMVGHILRYHPAIKRLRELVAGGSLGQVEYVYSNRLNIGKFRTEENILWSFAPHDIAAILSILDEEPVSVSCVGSSYLQKAVADVTVSHMAFASGVRAHVFVSWLHPFKEQRLVVVGSQNMAVFDDTAEKKLCLYPHKVAWEKRVPAAIKAEAEQVDIEKREPLLLECEHFVNCLKDRSVPVTDGKEGLRVLRILDACQRSMKLNGASVFIKGDGSDPEAPYYVHPTACVDEGAKIGKGTKIWHYSHIMKNAVIGDRCIIGQNVNVDGGAVVGSNVKIQNNVSVYSGTVIEDDVFLGPSCVLTNVTNPRSQVNRHALYEKTVFRRGCTVGANATIVCGVTVGQYAFVAAGAVVTRNVPDYALVAGNPAKQSGWMSRHGVRLPEPDSKGISVCPESGLRYRVRGNTVKCIDLAEDKPLPPEMTKGTRYYDSFKTARRPAGKKRGKA
jgi:UDP-2-acetamido-3-amino-2,3-dideoxy-glucuronate N-acetyltransferase